MWRLLVLSFLVAAAAAAHESEADVSDVDDETDMGLDEEELKVLMTEDEKAMVMNKEPSQDKDNISFQVRREKQVEL